MQCTTNGNKKEPYLLFAKISFDLKLIKLFRVEKLSSITYLASMLLSMSRMISIWKVIFH